MKIRIFIALLAVRAATFLLRLFGRGGTSLPGKIALLVKKDLLPLLASGYRTIMVTGTNGKTTTSRIISNILRESGISYFENKSGANLMQGILASFAMNCSFSGTSKYEFAVIECDEAAFLETGPAVQPEAVVVTNLFRDQLDRYGEISHMIRKIRNGLLLIPETTVILNGDDSLSFSLSHSIKNNITVFGITEPPYGADEDFISDAPYCIRCKTRYEYGFRTYAHLGDFRCPSCGYSRKAPDISASAIDMNFEKSTFTMRYFDKEFRISPALPGAYNIYNVLAAAAAVSPFITDITPIKKGISGFESGFGRMEKIKIKNTDYSIVLVKNPAGLNQVFNFLSFDEHRKILVLILNDRFADGTDISWIWDANFEKLTSFSDKFEHIFLSGTRADELMLRLKYTGMDTDKLHLETDYRKLIDEIFLMNKKNHPVFILPTYTAMFEFRGLIARKFKLKEFWK